MESRKKINPMEKNIMEHKKMQELQNKIIGTRDDIVLTKVVPDINKRQFIKKGILGIIAGIGIAVISKVTRAATGGINFYGDSDAELVNSSKGVAKVTLKYDRDDSTLDASYNVTSVADNTNGFFTITFNVDFANVNYTISSSAGGTNIEVGHDGVSRQVGSSKITMADNDNTRTNATAVSIAIHGDQ
jgi:hypothetical protein